MVVAENQNTENQDLIWYACYGSNIDEDRFLAYIQGGRLQTINNNFREYSPCVGDAIKPRNSEPYTINHKLYFAETSKTTWGGHGVAFIGNRKDKRIKTLGRIYLISKAQFQHLFSNENGRTNLVEINYDVLNEEGKLDFDFRLYNRIIVLNREYKAYPIYTFTNKASLSFNRPCYEYILYIAGGIVKVHGLNNEEIVEYLKKSLKESKKVLRKIIEQIK